MKRRNKKVDTTINRQSDHNYTQTIGMHIYFKYENKIDKFRIKNQTLDFRIQYISIIT